MPSTATRRAPGRKRKATEALSPTPGLEPETPTTDDRPTGFSRGRILDLPPELLHAALIVPSSVWELAALAGTCRAMRELVESSSEAWRKQFAARHGPTSSLHRLAARRAGGWKTLLEARQRAERAAGPWRRPSEHEVDAAVERMARGPGAELASPHEPCAPVCISFLVDGSGSVSDDDFRCMTEFVQRTVGFLAELPPPRADAKDCRAAGDGADEEGGLGAPGGSSAPGSLRCTWRATELAREAGAGPELTQGGSSASHQSVTSSSSSSSPPGVASSVSSSPSGSEDDGERRARRAAAQGTDSALQPSEALSALAAGGAGGLGPRTRARRARARGGAGGGAAPGPDGDSDGAAAAPGRSRTRRAALRSALRSGDARAAASPSGSQSPESTRAQHAAAAAPPAAPRAASPVEAAAAPAPRAAASPYLVSIVQFSNDTRVELPPRPASSPETLAAVAGMRRMNGGTDLAAAIEQSAALTRDLPPEVRRVVALLTDGRLDSYHSRRAAAAAAELARGQGGAALHAFGVGRGVDRAELLRIVGATAQELMRDDDEEEGEDDEGTRDAAWSDGPAGGRAAGLRAPGPGRRLARTGASRAPPLQPPTLFPAPVAPPPMPPSHVSRLSFWSVRLDAAANAFREGFEAGFPAPDPGPDAQTAAGRAAAARQAALEAAAKERAKLERVAAERYLGLCVLDETPWRRWGGF